MFRALALRQSESDEGLTLETSASESLYGGQFTLSTQLIKTNYLVILPPTQHHSFFRNLPPLLNLVSRVHVLDLNPCTDNSTKIMPLHCDYIKKWNRASRHVFMIILHVYWTHKHVNDYYTYYFWVCKMTSTQ